MKCVIIYFSQTGNTEKVARAIQAGVKQVAGNCELLTIREANPLGLKDHDLIGLGSPVMGAAPANVQDFVRKMRFVGGKHIFTFSTHGTLPMFFYPSLYPKLKSNGLVPIGHADWYGDCFLLHMPQPYPTAGHPDETDLQEAEAFGREMALRSMKISAGETVLIPPASPEMPAIKLPVTAGGKPVIGQFTHMLKFHKEKCLYPKCTLCMDNCPMHGIDLTVNPPVLAKPCMDCEFCGRICPTGALDMDDWLHAMEEQTKAHFGGMLMALEAAEKEGKFRRKIGLDEINNTQAGFYKYTRHPQWIIGKGPQL